MKKLITVISCIMLAFPLVAQELKPDQVPQIVKTKLQMAFPQTMDIPVTWTKEKLNYRAKMTIMDAPAVMVLDSLGNTKRIERRINEEYLPENAKKHLKGLDPNYTVVTATKIVDEKGQTSYNTSVKIKSDISFDKDGKVILPPKK